MMKCICITGATQPDLILVSDILAQAGMKTSQPAERGSSIDIASWHEQALSMEDAGSGINPGRFMDQLAGDIFSANIKSNPWGWADTRSTWLLDYWLEFDPRIYFVLVYVSPQQMLASAMNSRAAIDSIDAVMQAWQAHYQHLLRFHLRNPQRSLLVDARECAQYSPDLIKYCASQWKLNLAMPAGTGPLAVAHDPLALYLAKQLCQEYPQTSELQHELAATITRLGNATPAGEQTPSEQIIAQYCALKDRSIESSMLQSCRDALDEAGQANGQLVQQLQQVQERLDNSLAQYEDKQKELGIANSALSERAAELALLQTGIEELKARCQEYETGKIAGNRSENELILQQLHRVQEELERYFLLHKDTQAQLLAEQTRWQRMLERNPGYCDFESIELSADENSTDNAIVWHVKGLNTGGHNLPEVVFTTFLEQGLAGFVLPRQFAGTDLLVRWPVCLSGQNEARIIPVGQDSNRKLRIDTLLDLSISDWDLCSALTALLAGVLQQPAKYRVPAGVDVVKMAAGFSQLGTFINKFPAIVRYDQVTLKREKLNQDYEHIWLKFTNLAFGNRRWAQFEFRLSCAGISSGRFGVYSALEFPEENGSAPFDAWFIESHDDFGGKLELRFAAPDAMDMDVWQRISAHDRTFLTALLERLPSILETLQSAGTQLQRPWKDWINLVLDIQRIYTLRVNPQSVATEAPAGVHVLVDMNDAVPELPDDVASVRAKTAIANKTRKAK